MLIASPPRFNNSTEQIYERCYLETLSCLYHFVAVLPLRFKVFCTTEEN